MCFCTKHKAQCYDKIYTNKANTRNHQQNALPNCIQMNFCEQNWTIKLMGEKFSSWFIHVSFRVHSGGTFYPSPKRHKQHVTDNCCISSMQECSTTTLSRVNNIHEFHCGCTIQLQPKLKPVWQNGFGITLSHYNSNSEYPPHPPYKRIDNQNYVNHYFRRVHANNSGFVYECLCVWPLLPCHSMWHCVRIG